ncbi:MAG: tetratricopeptide repeat-containing glycosyltransferase family protein, partial [Gammaproteobacteria bacterium]|nr:tetratricopeptide repeat-containing glycosyltransferase family protein [Gammaproteobacteria bacterium]
AVTAMPRHAPSWNNLGSTLKGRAHRENAHVLLSRASEAFRNAYRLDPEDARNSANLAACLHVQGDFDAAARYYQRAMALNPELTEPRWGLGHLCFELGQHRAACGLFRQVLERVPDNSLALSGLGLNLMSLGDMPAAETALRRSVELEPSASRNAALARFLLTIGEFEEGWRGYEHRGEVDGFRLERFGLPRWRGESLADRSILLFAEQGVGDEIMFASCFGDVIASARQCTILCDTRLAPLFARSFPAARVMPWPHADDGPAGLNLSSIDVALSFGSLPLYLRPERAAFPRAAYLRADPERVAAWRERLAQSGPGPYVGISWRGGRIARERRKRSTRVSDWSELAQSGTTLVNVQYDARSADLDAFREAGIALFDPEGIDPLQDMDEFAALLAALDRVVSVDNSSVHLAGALGIPTHVLLPVTGDWRWTWGEEQALWYPRVRLHRRGVDEQWHELLRRVLQITTH